MTGFVALQPVSVEAHGDRARDDGQGSVVKDRFVRVYISKSSGSFQEAFRRK